MRTAKKFTLASLCVASLENGEILKKELADRATLVNIPGAAHLLPLEQPDTTASHVISFIRKFDRKS